MPDEEKGKIMHIKQLFYIRWGNFSVAICLDLHVPKQYDNWNTGVY